MCTLLEEEEEEKKKNFIEFYNEIKLQFNYISNVLLETNWEFINLFN